MLLKDIQKITISEALQAAEKGIFFIIKDGKIKSITINDKIIGKLRY